MTPFTLSILPDILVVAQIPVSENLHLGKLNNASLKAVIYSSDEITFIGPNDSELENAKIEPGWRALKVAGPLDFSLVGVISKLSGILADAQISVFVLSTFSTDFILVKEQQLKSAVSALRKAGCLILEH
jgi:hypothetical protein